MPVLGWDAKVTLVDSTGSSVSPAASVSDGTAWTAGSTGFMPVGGVFNDSAAAVTSGQEGTARITTNRAFHVNLRTQAGVEILPTPALLTSPMDLAVTSLPNVGAVLLAQGTGGTLANQVLSTSSSTDAKANTLNGLIVQSFKWLYNESGWDKERANVQVAIQASTATGTGTVNTTITNYNGRAILLFANVSSYGAAGTFLMKVQVSDVAGNFIDIPGATTGTLTSGQPLIVAVGPVTWPANTATTFYASYFLPRTLRVVTTVGVNSVTFSQSYSLPRA